MHWAWLSCALIVALALAGIAHTARDGVSTDFELAARVGFVLCIGCALWCGLRLVIAPRVVVSAEAGSVAVTWCSLRLGRLQGPNMFVYIRSSESRGEDGPTRWYHVEVSAGGAALTLATYATHGTASVAYERVRQLLDSSGLRDAEAGKEVR